MIHRTNRPLLCIIIKPLNPNKVKGSHELGEVDHGSHQQQIELGRVGDSGVDCQPDVTGNGDCDQYSAH